MQKILVFWRDIPAQVIIKRGRERGKALLSPRFQAAIDRAAMRAGKGGSEAYMADWRRDSSSLSATGSLKDLALQEADSLEAQYNDDKLARLVASYGREEDYEYAT